MVDKGDLTAGESGYCCREIIMKRKTISLPWNVGFPRDRGLCPDNWFVIRHDLFSEDERGKGDYFGKWFRISHEGKHVYRCLRLNPSMGRDQIYLDWGARLRLGIRSKEKSKHLLEIKEANFWERLFLVGLKHIDPTMRANTALAIIGVSLGLISLLVTLVLARLAG